VQVDGKAVAAGRPPIGTKGEPTQSNRAGAFLIGWPSDPVRPEAVLRRWRSSPGRALHGSDALVSPGRSVL
jgi:hypothetical protein